MPYETIRFECADDIALITLNRPEVMNALNTRMRAEAFCSGQDLGDRVSAEDLDLERTLRDEYVPMLMAIYECPVPTIAAVNGPAAGAGANLALAADVVIASKAAMFLQAFTRIGLIPDAGGTYWLPRQIGVARAMGAALFAEPVSAEEAARWGMIWEAGDFKEGVLAFLEKRKPDFEGR